MGDWSSWNNFSTTAETRTHGAAHELTRIGSGTTPATILYDTKGNITQNQRTPGTSSTYQNYVWDFDNRMMSADTNGDNTADVTYEYDALGRRVARTKGATAVVYIHAGQQVVCDYTRGANANTTPVFRYVWGDYIDEPILRQTGSSTLLYYHHNQQYSTVALTSASGLVVTRYGYTAYGDQAILSHTGASQTYATYSNRISYTGRDWDDSLKAHYFRARWYDAALGRFVNRDPIGYVDGMGLYERVQYISNLFAQNRGQTRFCQSVGLRPQVTGDCGGAAAEMYWCFDPSTDYADLTGLDGWVIQRILVENIVTDCNGNDISTEDQFFYEAWRVKDGVVMIGDSQTPAHQSNRPDRFEIYDKGPNTKGFYEITGWVGFVQGYQLSYAGGPEKWYAPNSGKAQNPHDKNRHEPSAGWLPTLPGGLGSPKGWDHVAKFSRMLRSEWDCCCNPIKPTDVSGSHGWQNERNDHETLDF